MKFFNDDTDYSIKHDIDSGKKKQDKHHHLIN